VDSGEINDAMRDKFRTLNISLTASATASAPGPYTAPAAG